MRKMKRSLAIVLVMVMVVGAQSFTAFADEENAMEESGMSVENAENIEIMEGELTGVEVVTSENENVETEDEENSDLANEGVEVYAELDGTGVYAEELPTSGTCGDNLTWTLLEDGILTVSGTGAMENFDFENPDRSAPWAEEYDGVHRIKKVIIEEGVTSIGNYAFDRCTALQEVVISNSVISIGDYAFDFCEALQKINIPESVTQIGAWALHRCGALQEVTIPGGVTNIGYATFFGSGLQKVNIEDGVTSIGDSAFRECGALQKINIPNSVTSIDTFAFSYCGNLQEINIPNGITNIGEGAFSVSGLRNVVIPESMTYISDSLFSNCTSLTSITIPSSITKIGRAAFSLCSSLSTIYFEGDAPEFGEILSVNKGMAESFNKVTAKVYFPAKNATWTADKMLNYGGDLTWVGQKKEDDITIVMEVTDKEYLIGSGGDATIKCTGELKDFVNVAMDGQLVDPSCYTVSEGSTVLTFLSSYLDTLSIGDHVVTLNYTYGSIDTTLTVLERKTNTAENSSGTNVIGNANNTSNTSQGGSTQGGAPKTGDYTPVTSWLFVMMMAGGGCILLVWTKKRKFAQ